MMNLPVHERPRERMLRFGPESLNERELLALVLRHGRPGESALDLSTSLLSQYGTLSDLAGAPPEELARWPGIGVAKAVALVAAFRLGRLASGEPSGAVLRSAVDVFSNVRTELVGLRRERVIVLVCDRGNRLRYRVVLTEGSIDRSLFPVRDILNAVLRHDGCAFAIAHNHPSGDPTPSEADLRVTEELAMAAETVGLRFLDHVVVGGDGWQKVASSKTRTSH